MARVEGFANGAEIDDLLWWDSYTVGSVTNSAAQARSGSRSYMIDSAAGTPSATKNMAADDEYWMRFCYYVTGVSMTTHNIVAWRSGGTTLGYLMMNFTTGLIGVYVGGVLRATCSIPVAKNTWYRIELYTLIADVNGVIQVRIDGVQAASYTGDTKPGAAATIDNFFFTSSTSNVTVYLDDFGLNDAAWCGDGHIEYQPDDNTGDVNQWTNNGGDPAALNYTYLQENPPDDDVTYIESNNPGDQDAEVISAFSLTGRAVVALWTEVRARGTVGAEQIKLGVKTNAVTTLGAAQALGASYARYTDTEHTVNPVTLAPWSQLQIDALQSVVENQ